MNEDVADGQLIDVTGADLSSLLTDSARMGVQTALDWVFTRSTTALNGFNNSI